MSKTKKNKKKQNSGLSTGAIIAIVIGVVLIVAILADTFSTQNEEEEEKLNVETEQAQVEQNDFFNGNNFFEEDNDEEYEKANALWEQYVNVLENDEADLEYNLNEYCTGEVSQEEFNTCVNIISPIIKKYITHITNAQNFLSENNEVFGNTIELQAWLDDKATDVDSFQREINSLM